jgi:hypothetical protein
MTRDEAIAFVGAWARTKSAMRDVQFVEPVPQPMSPGDDYAVVYEAVFEPSSLTKASIEIWITDEGNVGIGFERISRIRKRFKARGVGIGSKFVAGNEPMPVEQKTLAFILEAAANGKFLIVYSKLLDIVFCLRTYIMRERTEDMRESPFPALRWVRPYNPNRFLSSSGMRCVAGFAPWSEADEFTAR